MSKSQRWITLVREIDLRPGQTARELADKLGCSVRTVQRYIQQMPEELDIVAYNDNGYRFHNKPFFSPLTLNREEIVSIILAQRLASQQLDKQTSQALEAAVDKIRGSLGSKAQLTAKKLEHRTAVVAQSDTTSDTKQNLFQELTEAIQHHQQIYFHYQGRKDEEAIKRHVEPLGLSYQEGRWYLHAYDIKREGKRIFRLGRMSELEVTSVNFEPKSTFTQEKAAFHQWDLIKGNPIPITLKVSPGLARWFEENKPHPSVDVEDTTVRLSVTDTEAFLRWFVSLDDAELIAPSDCRDSIRERLEQMIECYRT